MALVNFLEGMDFGAGYDALTLKKRGDGVLRTAPQSTAGGGGQVVEFALTQVTSLQDIHAALHLDANASASLELIEGSGSFSFSSSFDLTSYSVNLLVAVTAH